MLVQENPAERRYEAIDDDGTVAGFVDYSVRAGRSWLIHTEVGPAHQGSGVAAFLVRKTLDDLRSKGLLVVPACPYVAGWIRRHPDYQDLVDERTFRELKRSRSNGRRRTVAQQSKTEPAPAQAGNDTGPCQHVPQDDRSGPNAWPVDGCAECLAIGHRDWVHLRVCFGCGHVGCCDNSPGKHATAHATLSSHPLIRSYEPGEDWWFCYEEVVTFVVADAPAAPSYPANTEPGTSDPGTSL